MSSRNALVIGSNCAALGADSLDFIPDVATDLFGVLTDPETGGCDPQESVLLIDPTLTRMSAEIKSSVRRAAAHGASLIVSFVGHGVAVEVPHGGSQLYLLPMDGAAQPDTDSGYQFGQRLREILGSEDAQGLDGLLVLLDVCSGGVGLLDGTQEIFALAGATDTRLELLSSVFDLPARGGCFTRTVASGAGQGLASLSSDFITPSDVADLVSQQCAHQEAPLRIAMARGRRVLGDPGLWIARNRAAKGIWPLAESHSGGLAVELTRRYVPTRQIRRVVEAMAASPVTVVTGEAGQGKSALTAALARPEVVPSLIPAGFLSALAFGSLTPTSGELAQQLHSQLVAVPYFTAAVTAFEARYEHKRELTILSPLQRLVFGPLSCVEPPEADTMRIAIDGFDALSPLVQHDISTSISQLYATASVGDAVRFLITSRASPPASLRLTTARHVEMAGPDAAQASQFLADKPAATPLSGAGLSVDSWLELVVLAEALDVVDLARVASARTNDDLYSALLDPLLDTDTEVLVAILVTAGVGPVMPLSVLTGASRLMDGPSTLASVADTIVELGRLVSRSKPGTSDEHVGLSHEALLAWARSHPSIAALVATAHRAVLDVLDEDAGGDDDPLAVYRSRAKADHLWALGDHEKAVEAVLAECGTAAADSLALLARWVDTASTELSVDHPVTLGLGIESTRWRARSGAVAEARAQAAELVAAAEAAGVGESREGFRARLLDAELEGRVGNPERALELARQLAERTLNVLGELDPLSLEARSEVARWLGQVGDWQAASDAHRDVWQQRSTVLGPDAIDTLRSRGFLAHATAKLGDPRLAADMYAATAQAQEEARGEADRDALNYRLNELRWRAKARDYALAVRHCYRLIPLMQQALGPEDPQTLFAYSILSQSKAADGHLGEALRVLDYVIPRYEDVLGKYSTETLFARVNRANWRARLYGLEGGYEELIDLVEEISAVLPADHDAVLHARGNLAYWTARSGATEAAGTMYEALIADLTRIRGARHPETLHSKRLLAKVENIRRPDSAARDREARLAEALVDTELDRVLPDGHRHLTGAVSYDDFALGQVRRVRVTRVVDFGAFVDADGFRGLVHSSELGWDVRRPQEVVAVGDELTVVVSRLEPDSRRVAFSLKRATTDPLLTWAASHPLGSRVKGVVVGPATGRSVEIALPGGVMAHLVGAASVPVEAEVDVTVADIDTRARRVTVRLAPEDGSGPSAPWSARSS